jgi:hypothetical protein
VYIYRNVVPCVLFGVPVRVGECGWVRGGGRRNFYFRIFPHQLFSCFFGTGLFKNRPGVGMALWPASSFVFFFFVFLI